MNEQFLNPFVNASLASDACYRSSSSAIILHRSQIIYNLLTILSFGLNYVKPIRESIFFALLRIENVERADKPKTIGENWAVSPQWFLANSARRGWAFVSGQPSSQR